EPDARRVQWLVLGSTKYRKRTVFALSASGTSQGRPGPQTVADPAPAFANGRRTAERGHRHDKGQQQRSRQSVVRAAYLSADGGTYQRRYCPCSLLGFPADIPCAAGHVGSGCHSAGDTGILAWFQTALVYLAGGGGGARLVAHHHHQQRRER